MRRVNLIAAALMVGAGAAHASDLLDKRMDLMTLAFACSNDPSIGVYRAARNAAMRQAERDRPGSDRVGEVVDLDRALKDGKIKVNAPEKGCDATIEEATAQIRAAE